MTIKNFFDFCTDQDNQRIVGYPYCVKEPDESLKALLDEQDELLQKYLHDSLLAGPFSKVPAVVCFALSVVSAFGAFKTISGKGFTFTSSNGALALVLLALCIGTLAVAFAILAKSKKEGSFSTKSELERCLDDLNTRIDKAQASLFEIPENAKTLDVFYNYYTVKDGKRVVETESVFEYSFDSYTYFYDNENLYFTDAQAKYAIPLSSIKDVKLIESETTFDSWDKDEEMDGPTYEKYDIYDKTEDCISINSYAELYISDENGYYKIVVPGYEYNKLKELIL